MQTPVKDKKRFSLFALLGLFVIFSMLITSVVDVRALSSGQITETIAIANPEFTDTVGGGLEDEGAPTPAPTGEIDAGGEDGELTGTPTEKGTLEVTEEPDLEETPAPDEVEATPIVEVTKETEEPTDDDVEETPSPEGTETPEESKEPDLVDETPTPEVTEEPGDGEETPSPEALGLVDMRTVDFPNEIRKGGGNSGSIKTTKNPDCSGAVNANHYAAGEMVYIHGENFKPGSYNWNIKGQPGNASEDPNQVVASGTYIVDQSGSFCLAAYTINADDGGVYKVNFGKNKTDNFSVNKTVEEPKTNALTVTTKTNGCDSVLFNVTLIGDSIDSGVIVNLTTEPNSANPSPTSLTFNAVGETKEVAIMSAWANNRQEITLTATISGDSSTPGYGASAQATAVIPDDCSGSCPGAADGWDFYAGLGNVTSYVHTAPEGKLISKVCYKAGPFKNTYDVDPASETTTVTTSFTNQGGNNIHPISHVSFLYVEAPNDATVTLTPSCKWENDASNITVVFSLTGVSSLTWKSGAIETTHQVSGDTLTITNLTPGIYSYSWIGAEGYKDGSATGIELIGCQPASLQVSESCTWNGTNSLVDVTFSSLVGVASIKWDDTLYSDLSAGSLTITNQSAGSHTYSWTAQSGYVGGEEDASINLENCDPVLITLDATCLPNGKHEWTVTNPNPLAIEFSWASDIDNQNGNLTVAANGTKKFQTNYKAQTVTLTYAYPLNVSLSRVAVAPVEAIRVEKTVDRCENPFVRITYMCYAEEPGIEEGTGISMAAGQYLWRVRHEGGLSPVTFYTHPASANMPDVSGTITDGETLYFPTTNHFNGASIKTNERENLYKGTAGVSGTVCFYPLELDYTCLPNGEHQWTVTNSNGSAYDFTWSTDNGQSSNGTLTVPESAGGVKGTVQFTSDLTSHTMTIFYGTEKSTSVEADSCKIQYEDLIAEPICGYPGESTRFWQISNPNDVDIDYTWKGYKQTFWGYVKIAEGNLRASVPLSILETSSNVAKLKIYIDGELVSTANKTAPCKFDLTIWYTCESDGSQKWNIKNYNNFDQDFSLSIDGEPATSEVVLAGETYTFSLANGVRDIVISYQNMPHAMRTKTLTSEVCTIDLSIEPICGYADDAQLIWQINNPNPYLVNYLGVGFDQDWNLEYWGLNSAPAGISYISSPAEVWKMIIIVENIDIDWAYRADACLIDLKLNVACQQDGQHKWTVTNDNEIAYDFNWTSSDELQSGTGSVSGNGTTYFYTDASSQTISITTINTAPFSSRTVTQSAEACVLEPLVLYSCREFDNSHIWTIENQNIFTISVRTKLNDGDFGDWLEILAGDTAELSPSSSGIQTLTVQYRYSDETIQTMEPIIAEECKLSGLTLSFLCGYPSDDALFWNITNPFDFDVDFVVVVDGGAAAAKQTVPANGETIIQTALGSQTAVIYVNGNEVARANSGETCLFDLALDYQCLESGKHQWTVTNNNKESILFNWHLNGSLNGANIGVKAGETATFTTVNGTHTVRIEHVDEIFGTKMVEMTAEACKITVVTPEPPTYVIPNVVSGTCQPWIVFHTYRDGNMEIYRLDGIEGIGDFQLFNLSKGSSYDSHPSRSFDDAWVAFQSYRDGNNEIYYTDSSGNRQVRLTNNAAQDINPMFSPDNVNIVFQSNRNGSWDLYLVNRLTDEEIQLTDHSADEIHPFFSMDKNWLVFESNQNGNWDIFRLNLATGEEIQVTDGSENETHPTWSPNGQKIAYLAPVDGITQLFVADINGTNKTQITTGDGDTSNHSWSPDSTRLAYQSERDGNVDIYAYDLRDNTEYRVTDGAEKDVSPTWDCGGVNLAFSSKGDGSSMDIYMSFWKGGGSSYMTDHPAMDKWSQWSPAMELGSRGK